MFIIDEMALSGIGRFVDEQVIDISSFGNLVQVDGENKNTGGSSAVGKSIVFKALEYVLGLNNVPIGVLQSRLTKESISVRLKGRWDNIPVQVHRNKKGLRVIINGEVFEGSSKLTEEKLDMIIGMSRELFRKILHKRQKEGGFFLQFTPKQMYEFLIEATGAKGSIEKLATIEADLAKLEKAKVANGSALSAAQTGLAATQSAILGLGLAPVKNIDQGTILELKAKYDVSAENLKLSEAAHKLQSSASAETLKSYEMAHRLQSETLDLQRPVLSVPAFDTSEIKIHEEALNHLRKIATDLVASEQAARTKVTKEIADLKTEQTHLQYKISAGKTSIIEAARIAAEIKKIRDSLCPKCEQTWVTEKAKSEEASLLVSLQTHKASIDAGNAASSRNLEIAATIDKLLPDTLPKPVPGLLEMGEKEKVLQQKIAEIRLAAQNHNTTHTQQNQALLDAFSAQQKSLREQQAAEIGQIRDQHNKLLEQQAAEIGLVRGQADVDRKAFEASVNSLKSFEDLNKSYQTSVNNLKTQEIDYQNRLTTAQAEATSLTDKLALAEESKRAVKGFTSRTFEDALEAIGDTATRIIRCIPTMANATIQFIGDRETQDGKLKEEINAVISMDGYENIPIKSLCGGEDSSVDLAVDLSVIDYVESKTGKGTNIFILDEPFTGLDTVCIEEALAVLKNSNINKKIIVVDHNPIIKESMTDRIVVVRTGDQSVIMDGKQ